jgi:putative nucleotidyltransferase with HDIG domain
LAHLLGLKSWFGLLLLVLPFTAARRTFRVYVELSEAFTATVRSLVAAIEAKDPYTRGHSERVAIYARRLAERLHMPRAQVDLTEQAALLHDVGKIGISLRTLTSSEQLRVDEVHQIRRHPVLGAELVEDVEFLSSIVPVIRHHHERPDGTGYPDGLVAAQIPVLARVLAVADCYDAMTSDRAYRVRMTRDEALDEMVRVAGAQLDEDLVSEFREMILADDSAEGGIQ